MECNVYIQRLFKLLLTGDDASKCDDTVPAALWLGLFMSLTGLADLAIDSSPLA